MTHTVTNAAIVLCTNPQFHNDLAEEDPDQIRIEVEMRCNGATGIVGGYVIFPSVSTNAVKTTAVRAAVNAVLAEHEPGVTLGNAAIQIVGLPV
ncbi:MAG: hypothetical protein QM523_01010 [Candidatus Pacebacteria bacterium]|nr:hypothetical protein [Candidatus Paceibacterota bacterium]